MKTKTFSARIIRARFSKPGSRLTWTARFVRAYGFAIVAALSILPAAGASTPLTALLRAYRESPTPVRRAAVQAYVGAHPNEASIANLTLGITAYEQKDYARAISLLVPVLSQLPQIADYASYYLAAARVESSDFAPVSGGLAAAHRNSPLGGRSWILEARALESTNPTAGATLLSDHYAELPQPEGDVTLGDCYRAASDPFRAAQAYQRVYSQYLTGASVARAAAALAELGQGMGSPEQLLHRAGRMLDARDYTGAKHEYLSLAASTNGLERDQARVRAGAADYLRGQVTLARPYLSGLELTPSEADAERLYYLAECARQQKDDAAMSAALDRLAGSYRSSPWRLKALLTAANRFLVVNRSADYLPLYRAICQDFPTAPQAALAHWKVAFQSYLSAAPDADLLLREHLRNYPGHATTGAALYFVGRQAERAGDNAMARACYQRLSSALENTYYGLLARDRLRVPEVAGATLPLPTSETDRFLVSLKLAGAQAIPSQPSQSTVAHIERSRVLRAAGLDDLADSELRFGCRSDGQSPLLSIEMASSAPAPYQAMKIMKALNPDYLNLPIAAAPRQFWEMLFPLPYKKDLVSSAEERKLDPYLIAGLIRQESEFNPQALSRAKAYGLTQVRPATGRLFARKAGVPRFTTRTLYQPAANLKIGTSILRSMLDQHDGSIEQTLAAYNAGPNRVVEWRTWANFREPAEFVESIPFTETRDYVQAVLRNAEMYRRLYQ
jgi:soluble lytic murein transglycosylase